MSKIKEGDVVIIRTKPVDAVNDREIAIVKRAIDAENFVVEYHRNMEEEDQTGAFHVRQLKAMPNYRYLFEKRRKVTTITTHYE